MYDGQRHFALAAGDSDPDHHSAADLLALTNEGAGLA
jgi:hypothetical protein